MNTGTPERQAGWRRRRHLRYALVMSGVLVLAQFGNVLPVLRDHLQGYLGIGDREYGILFGLGPLVGVGSVLAGGVLVPRWGPVRMLRRCLLGVAGSMLVLALAGNRWRLVLLGVTLAAVFSGPLFLAANTYLTRLFPHERRRVLALSLAISGAGGMLIPMVGEGLLALAARGGAPSFGVLFRGLFLGLAAALAGVAMLYRRRHPRRILRGRGGLAWSVRLSLPVAWLVVLMALHAAVDTSLYYWMPRFLGSTVFARALVPPGLVMGGYSLAYLVSRSLLMLVPEHRGRSSLLCLPGLLGGSILVGGIISREYALVAAGYVFGAFLWSAEYPAMLGAAADCDKHRFAAAMAVAQIIAGPLTAALTFGIGHVAGRFGEQALWQPMAWTAAGFVVIGIGGGLWVVRHVHGNPSPAKRAT